MHMQMDMDHMVGGLNMEIFDDQRVARDYEEWFFPEMPPALEQFLDENNSDICHYQRQRLFAETQDQVSMIDIHLRSLMNERSRMHKLYNHEVPDMEIPDFTVNKDLTAELAGFTGRLKKKKRIIRGIKTALCVAGTLALLIPLSGSSPDKKKVLTVCATAMSVAIGVAHLTIP